MYCNRCGSRLQQGAAVCPECGARQRRQTRIIRCARCRGTASIEMTVCPHCGHNLVPAGPRWSVWIPLVLLIAFAGYWGWGRLPVEQVKGEAVAAQARISNLVQIPEVATSTPALIAEGPGAAGRTAATSTPTRTPTATLTRTPSPAPSATATPTPTEAAQEYVVESGDSLALIGEKVGVPWETIAKINGLNAYSMLQPGDKLRLPTPSAVPATAAAMGTAPEYVVESGDSLALIGEKVGVPWETIAQINGLNAYSMLQPGDKLRLPTPTAAPVPTATATPTRSPITDTPTVTPTATNRPTIGPSPTPAPATDTPTVSPTTAATATSEPPTETPLPPPTATPTNTPAPILSIPILIGPGNQNSVKGESAQIMLEWQSKNGLPAGAVYRVTIVDAEKGTPVARTFDTTATSIRVPLWLWGRADQPARQYDWWVQIVQVTTDGKGGERAIELSPPSERRTFYWN